MKKWILCRLFNKHDWEVHLHYKLKSGSYSHNPYRECLRCGKLQQHLGFGIWMDVHIVEN